MDLLGDVNAESNNGWIGFNILLLLLPLFLYNMYERFLHLHVHFFRVQLSLYFKLSRRRHALGALAAKSTESVRANLYYTQFDDQHMA